MGPVDLTEDVPGVDEQHLVLARRVPALALVEEPERHRQRHRVEEVRADRDDHVDGAALDELAADLQLRLPPASAAEFAMTNPARPLSFSAE